MSKTFATLEEFREILRGDGWRRDTDHIRHLEMFWKRFHTKTRCRCNSDKQGVQICLFVYESLGELIPVSFEFELTAEKPDGEWVKLQTYGLRLGDMVSTNSQVMQLLAAWEAMCAIAPAKKEDE